MCNRKLTIQLLKISMDLQLILRNLQKLAIYYFISPEIWKRKLPIAILELMENKLLIRKIFTKKIFFCYLDFK